MPRSGQLKVENEFFKKKKASGNLGITERASLISPHYKETIDCAGRCGLLGVGRGRLYYKPVGEKKPENIKIMEIMDKHLTDHPTEGDRIAGVVFNSHLNIIRVGPKAYPTIVEDYGSSNDFTVGKSVKQENEREFIKPYLLRGLDTNARQSGLVY